MEIDDKRYCVFIIQLSLKMTLSLSQSNFYAETTSPSHPIPKGDMRYAQYTVPDTVAVEPTFAAFL